ncbi:MAG: GCN5-related N-acetyltransferase, partial [uncultured Acetobacteraceae bacterium]
DLRPTREARRRRCHRGRPRRHVAERLRRRAAGGVPRRPVPNAPCGRLRAGHRRPAARPRHVRRRGVGRRRAAGAAGRGRRHDRRLRVRREGAAPGAVRRSAGGERRGGNALPAGRLPRPRPGPALDARHGGAPGGRWLPLGRALGAPRQPDPVVLPAPGRPRGGAGNDPIRRPAGGADGLSLGSHRRAADRHRNGPGTV